MNSNSYRWEFIFREFIYLSGDMQWPPLTLHLVYKWSTYSNTLRIDNFKELAPAKACLYWYDITGVEIKASPRLVYFHKG